MTARIQPGMALPPHDSASGEITEYWNGRDDTRVPRPMRRPGESLDEHPARVLAQHRRSDACPDGRHLWDVIESVIEREVDVDDDRDEYGWSNRPSEDFYEYDFRSVMTCVRCGLVNEWEGTRKERPARTVDPTPLRAGDLVAQQVGGDSGSRDCSTWHIYRADQLAGVIVWARGQRGRAFHQARLHSWEPGEVVEGKDPAAALRAVLHRCDAPARSRAADALAGPR